MSVFFHQFFDVNFMLEHFGEVLEGFWLTIQIWFVAAILALIWGLILALMRQAPGKKLLPIRFVSIAYIDIFRAIPALLLIVLTTVGAFGLMMRFQPRIDPTRAALIYLAEPVIAALWAWRPMHGLPMIGAGLIVAANLLAGREGERTGPKPL